MTYSDDTSAAPEASAHFWGEEENFWLEGPDYYRAHMVPDAVMSFPEPTGLLKGEQVLAALENAPRWDRVVFFDKTRETLGNKVRLTYRAEGWKDGAASYLARCESTYVKMGGDWLLASHKQEPIKS
ncbi:nuclear transport factor 2 family protein [Maritimibacter sp. DP1N21-5]|uniref:nuclear transport factor 2 family protein n=1 Tax=Maritimibacter sp. DP1N21-5 TaxID=2836867 RepID=UPI001C43E153|nr:nuclear transport factor 2 family protein [Maritimibacter sp. DP1N21-5]MBV7407599.1 nuclear transport factor 2 family protein [Maritimibacter sp. DP1N21-5]